MNTLAQLTTKFNQTKQELEISMKEFDTLNAEYLSVQQEVLSHNESLDHVFELKRKVLDLSYKVVVLQQSKRDIWDQIQALPPFEGY